MLSEKFSIKKAENCCRDEKEAYLRQYTEEGDPEAACMLGLYLDEKEQDTEYAGELIESHADGVNDPLLRADIGRYHCKKKNYEKGAIFLSGLFPWLDKHCTYNAKNAKFYAEYILAVDECLEVCNINRPTEFLWMERLAEGGNETARKRFEAHNDLDAAAEQGIPESWKQTLLRKAAENGSREALYKRGSQALDANDLRGLDDLKAAAERGSAGAYLRLVNYYYGKEERDEALCWCKQGIAALLLTKRLSNDNTFKKNLEFRSTEKCMFNQALIDETLKIYEKLCHLQPQLQNPTRKDLIEQARLIMDRITDGTRDLAGDLAQLSDQLFTSVETLLRENRIEHEELERLLEKRSEKLEEMNLQTIELLREALMGGENEAEILLRQRRWDDVNAYLAEQFEGVWDKFLETTRNSLLTAVLYMNSYSDEQAKGISNNYNFNFLTMPLVTALEMELKEKFYYNYIRWCETKHGPFAENREKWPKELVYFKNGSRHAVNNKFMLGIFIKDYRNSASFREFLKEYYGNAQDEGQMNRFFYALDALNQRVRIDSAHHFLYYPAAEEGFLKILGFVRGRTAADPLLKQLGRMIISE